MYNSLYPLIDLYLSVNLPIPHAHFDFIKKTKDTGRKTQRNTVNSPENITNNGTVLFASLAKH